MRRTPELETARIDPHQSLYLEPGGTDFCGMRLSGIQKIDLVALARRNLNCQTDLGFQVSEAGAKRSPFPA
jgi:hypothetical protein